MPIWQKTTAALAGEIMIGADLFAQSNGHTLGRESAREVVSERAAADSRTGQRQHVPFGIARMGKHSAPRLSFWGSQEPHSAGRERLIRHLNILDSESD